MPPADGDIYKGVVIIDLPSLVVANNVFFWRLDDPTPDNPTNAQVVNSIDNKLTAMLTDIQGSTANDVTYDEFEVDKVEWNAVGAFWETVESLGSQALAIVGSNATDAVPHGVAAVITANTSWPKTRGRKFFPGIAEDSIVDSTLSGALLTALSTMVVEWLTAGTVTGSAVLVPVVASVLGTKAGTVLDIVSAGPGGIAGYQRRRKPGVGA